MRAAVSKRNRRAARSLERMNRLEEATRKWPSLTHRLFMALLLLAVMAFVLVGVFCAFLYESSSRAAAHQKLDSDIQLISALVQLDPSYNQPSASAETDNADSDAADTADTAALVSTLQHVADALADVHISLSTADGIRVFDSADGSSSENSNGSEGASGNGSGSNPDAAPPGYQFISRTQALSDGSVLQLDTARPGFLAVLLMHGPLFVLAFAVLALACWAASVLLVRKLMKPVRQLVALSATPRIPGRSYREFAPLVKSMSEQKSALIDKMDTLRNANAMRLQFTANVTHELKTPLTSISGAAELIRDGIAQPEHIPDFAGRIYDEAQHLTGLVNDILTLSRLDEAERTGSDQGLIGPVEPVDLLLAARDVARRLERPASRAQVSISCTGSSQIVLGQPHLIDELLYNLADNSIRYNRPGGSVLIEVGLRRPAHIYQGRAHEMDITGGAQGAAHKGAQAGAAQAGPHAGTLSGAPSYAGLDAGVSASNSLESILENAFSTPDPDSIIEILPAGNFDVVTRVDTNMNADAGTETGVVTAAVSASDRLRSEQEGVSGASASGDAASPAINAGSSGQEQDSASPSRLMAAFVRVSDTGNGIPQDSQRKVFERFYRLEKSRSRESGGTGLGLAIVKHAAAFHKAGIEVESEAGKGTRITVTFPVDALVDDTDSPDSATATSQPPASS